MSKPKSLVHWLLCWCRGWRVGINHMLPYIASKPGISGREIRKLMLEDGFAVSSPTMYMILGRAEDDGVVRGENVPITIGEHETKQRCFWLHDRIDIPKSLTRDRLMKRIVENPEHIDEIINRLKNDEIVD